MGPGANNYKIISIPIRNEYKFDKKAKLEVELYEPNGGATLGKVTKTIINIASDPKPPKKESSEFLK